MDYIYFDANLQYRNLQPSDPIRFSIQVDKKEKVFSNLKEVGYNQFEGEAYGATLVLGELLENELDEVRVIAPPDMSRSAKSVLDSIKNTVKIVNQNTQSNAQLNIKHIFVVPISSSVNSFPIEYGSNQLFIDAHDLSIFKNTYHFSNPSSVIPCFYWLNEYRSADGRVAILLTCLYNQLYEDTNREWYTFDNLMKTLEYAQYQGDPKAMELHEVAKKILDLYKQGRTEELEKMENQLFIMSDEDTLDFAIIQQFVNELQFQSK